MSIKYWEREIQNLKRKNLRKKRKKRRSKSQKGHHLLQDWPKNHRNKLSLNPLNSLLKSQSKIKMTKYPLQKKNQSNSNLRKQLQNKKSIVVRSEK